MKKEHSQEIEIIGVFNYVNSVSGFITEYNDIFEDLNKKNKNDFIKLILDKENKFDENAVRVLVSNENNIFSRIVKSPTELIDNKPYVKIGYLKNDEAKLEIVKLLKKQKNNFKFLLENLERVKIGNSVRINCNLDIFIEDLELLTLKKITLIPNKEINQKIRQNGYDLSI